MEFPIMIKLNPKRNGTKDKQTEIELLEIEHIEPNQTKEE